MNGYDSTMQLRTFLYSSFGCMGEREAPKTRSELRPAKVDCVRASRREREKARERVNIAYSLQQERKTRALSVLFVSP